MKQVLRIYCASKGSYAQVLALWGVGGAGKSTLAKALHRSLAPYFPDGSKAFVEASPHAQKQLCRALDLGRDTLDSSAQVWSGFCHHISRTNQQLGACKAKS